jgi:hypothetical protein
MATHSFRVEVGPVTTGTGWFRALVQWLAAGCGFMGYGPCGHAWTAAVANPTSRATEIDRGHYRE